MLNCEYAKTLHEFDPAWRQARATTVSAAGAAFDQRPVGQIVHCRNRIPGRPVAQSHGLGCCGDRTGLGDLFEQGDARSIGGTTRAKLEAELGFKSERRDPFRTPGSWQR